MKCWRGWMRTAAAAAAVAVIAMTGWTARAQYENSAHSDGGTWAAPQNHPYFSEAMTRGIPQSRTAAPAMQYAPAPMEYVPARDARQYSPAPAQTWGGYSWAPSRNDYQPAAAYYGSGRSIQPRYDAEVSADTPIEIFLSDRMGRFGPYVFPALGGRPTQQTPKGTFTVKFKSKDHYSYKYKAPMPLSLFFTDQCAIHIGSLEHESRGCVHVDPPTAEMLWHYAKAGRTKVKVYP